MPLYQSDPMQYELGIVKSEFLFTICQIGAEKALKDELAANHPDLRFAYSRPGFVTFKNSTKEMTPDVELQSIFARAYGLSLSKASSSSEAWKWIEENWEKIQGSHLHVFECDRYFPGDEPEGF
jgi:23S rRNA (cytidine2498-2'-O)-methyltransferase